MDKVKNILTQLKLSWREVLLVLLSVALIYTVISSYKPAMDAIKGFSDSAVELVEFTSKDLESDLNYCEPVKEFVFKTDDFLARKNVVVLDLDTFELFKKQRINRKQVGYYYRMTGKEKIFYTVFKNETKEDNSSK